MELNFHDFKGSLRVGRMTYDSSTSEGGLQRGNKPIYPSYPGFTPVIVLTKSSPYGELGPYVLKDEEGRIMENIWQFSKVYAWVPKTQQKYSRWDSTLIWDYPEEVHMTNGKLNSKYWKWRDQGMHNEYPVRYPVGNTKHRKECLYCLKEKDGKELNYVEARKEIYLDVYGRLVKQQPKFKKLQERLKNGENLLIIEVDGPHQESLEYYKETYGVDNNFINQHTILVDLANMEIMLNDTKHCFGHGYCLAIALLEWPIQYL
jgi:hypothetical protein